MRVVAALAALPLLLSARPAWPCGGGSGGSSGGSSGGGGGGGGGGDSSSSSSSAAPCEDTSEVVGRVECRSYGSGWDSRRVPPTVITIGTSLHFLPMRGLRFAGTAHHDAGYSYAVRGEQTGEQAVASTFDMRTTMRLGRYLYGGAESQVGKLYVDGDRLAMNDSLVIDPRGLMYVASGVVAGVRLPLGDLELHAEALAGVRIVSLAVTSYHDGCEDNGVVSDIEPLLETRLAATTWLSPWVSLGAMVGSNTLQRGDVSGGIFLDGHLRAFDGGR